MLHSRNIIPQNAETSLIIHNRLLGKFEYDQATLRPGEIANFRHITQKSPILTLVPGDSPFNGKLCGVLFSPEQFYVAEKFQNTELYSHDQKSISSSHIMGETRFARRLSEQ